jgi:hypothetical protein
MKVGGVVKPALKTAQQKELGLFFNGSCSQPGAFVSVETNIGIKGKAIEEGRAVSKSPH